MIDMSDKEMMNLIREEETRQKNSLSLIASENYVSQEVLKGLGSVFTNKYAEGYPKARYYGGNQVADKVESLAQKRALKLFGLSPRTWSVNVQPYSGSPANLAILHALVPPKAKIMGMSLDMGGHLTHGHKVSLTGKLWTQVPYGVNRISETLDYGEILNIARREKPHLIIAGGTAYSRKIDFKRFRIIADEVGAFLMVDMSHFAGLVAGGAHPSPFKHAHIVMTTVHKTLRGPRAALIFSQKEFSKKIDRTVFPGMQGGPHLNQIAAIGTALDEASKPVFKKYAHQVVRNAQTLASELEKHGWRIISGGTDTHLFLVDTFSSHGTSGKEASEKLEKVGIVLNMNMIPNDPRVPKDPSGIRVGTPGVTTRGMKEREMKTLATVISDTLLKKRPQKEIAKDVLKLCNKFKIK